MEVKRPFFLVILTILLVGFVLLGLSDTAISVDDTRLPNNEAISSVSKASDSSTSAKTVITMYTVPDE